MEIFFETMQRPLLACLLLPGLLVYLGLHIVRREIIFVDLALAQVAALGSAVAIIMHYEPLTAQNYACSLAFTLVGAAIFTLTRTQHEDVPQEALIGIVYVVAAAGGILVLSNSAEGNEELRRSLIGDVLLVSYNQIWRTFALYLIIAIVHFIFRKRFLAISFEPDRARAADWRLRWWDFLFYAMFGWVVTSFVQIGGVLLVFSYLIVPAVCANFLARSLRSLLLIGCAVSISSSLVGLGISYRLDWPTGAAIVCVLGAALVVCGILARLKHRPPPPPPLDPSPR